MQQGHQERLAPLVAEVMSEAGLRFEALDRIGVAVGPGSFTGLRVGLAFAKGLGLALGRPVIGIDSLQAMAASADRAGPGLVVIDARRGQAYVRRFAGTTPTTPSEAVMVDDLGRSSAPAWIAGPGVELVASLWPDVAVDDRPGADPVAVARLAADADPSVSPPEPIYLRAPDAKLPGGIDP